MGLGLDNCGVELTCAGHCLGPVDHEGVNVVQLEILQGLHDVGLDVLRPVVGVPELGLNIQLSLIGQLYGYLVLPG